MTNRRVIYRTDTYRAQFMVDDAGNVGGISIAAENGASMDGTKFNDVPWGPLAEFARQYGNLTVNTGELKTAGRKPRGEGA